MIKKLHSTLLFLVIFSVVIQTGKHFWPEFAFVEGVRLDYLSPTLYISDIFILLYIFLSIKLCKKKLIESLTSKNLGLWLFILLLLASTLFSKNFLAALFGLTKLVEFAMLSVSLAFTFEKKDVKTLILALVASSTMAVFIGILQLTTNHSLGGIFYYLGERNYNSSTINIAKFNLNGYTLVRPYSTFPHPNIFAFYLLVSGIIVSWNVKILKHSHVIVILLATIMPFLMIPFTFARTTIVTMVAYLLYVFSRFGAKKVTYFIFLSMLSIFFYVFSSRFVNFSLIQAEINSRQVLVKIAFEILNLHPIFGVGLNNFFFHEIAFQRTVTPIFLQPAHNIYIHLLVQVGYIGFLLIVTFIFKTFSALNKGITTSKSNVANNFYNSIRIVLIAVLFIGFFDHFLVTLQQGQQILAILLGLSWNKNLNK